MASEYRIQIVHADSGLPAHSWEPSARGLSPFGVEKDLETELLSRIKAKGVGLGRTSNHVLADVQAALREMLFDLKSLVR